MVSQGEIMTMTQLTWWRFHSNDTSKLCQAFDYSREHDLVKEANLDQLVEIKGYLSMKSWDSSFFITKKRHFLERWFCSIHFDCNIITFPLEDPSCYSFQETVSPSVIKAFKTDLPKYQSRYHKISTSNPELLSRGIL